MHRLYCTLARKRRVLGGASGVPAEADDSSSTESDSSDDSQDSYDKDEGHGLERLDLADGALWERFPGVASVDDTSFFEALHENRHSLEVVSLRRNGLGQALFARLGDDLLKAAPNLTTLDVSGNKIEELPDLSTLPKLTTLRASDNRIRAVPNLFAHPALRSVDLSSNRLHVETSVGMVPDQFPGLAENCALRELRLRNNGLNRLDMQFLNRRLRANTTLEALDVRGNEIRDHGDGTWFLDSGTSAVTRLWLGDNRWTDEAADAVCRSIARYDRLVRLCVSGFRPSHGLQLIVQANPIRHLALRRCGLTSLDAHRLVRAFQATARAIKTLDLSHNRLNHYGAREMYDYLHANFGTLLDLRHNPLSAAAIENIRTEDANGPSLLLVHLPNPKPKPEVSASAAPRELTLNVGIEVETCLTRRVDPKHFDQVRDGSIKCKTAEQIPLEFVLRHYWSDRELDGLADDFAVIAQASDECKERSCGLHYHVSSHAIPNDVRGLIFLADLVVAWVDRYQQEFERAFPNYKYTYNRRNGLSAQQRDELGRIRSILVDCVAKNQTIPAPGLHRYYNRAMDLCNQGDRPGLTVVRDYDFIHVEYRGQYPRLGRGGRLLLEDAKRFATAVRDMYREVLSRAGG